MKRLITIALLIIGGIMPLKGQQFSYWGETINVMLTSDTSSTADSIYVLGELSTVTPVSTSQIRMYNFENGDFWDIKFRGECLEVVVGSKENIESKLADLNSYSIWHFLSIYKHPLKLTSIDITINYYNESSPDKLNSLRFFVTIGC